MLLLSACAAQPPSEGVASTPDAAASSEPSAQPEATTPSEPTEGSTSAQTWDLWMKWRKNDSDVFLPVSYNPWTGEVRSPDSVFYEKDLSEDLDTEPYRLSANREWVIVDASDVEVRVVAFPLSNRARTIALADIPVQSRTYKFGTVSFADGEPATLQIPLIQFDDDGAFKTTELWHIDLEDKQSQPELAATSPAPSKSMYNAWNTDFSDIPESQILTPWTSYLDVTGGVQFRGMTAATTVAFDTVRLADGSQLQLEVVSEQTSTTLRTWWKKTEADDWSAIGKSASIRGDVSGPNLLAFPTELPPAEG